MSVVAPEISDESDDEAITTVDVDDPQLQLAGSDPSPTFRGRRAELEPPSSPAHGGDKHDHGDIIKLPDTWNYTFTWVIDAIIMTLLKYVFCVVGAIIIHTSNPLFQPSLSIGIAVQLISTLITCIITSWKSKIGINISGPDIIAAIFAALWANTLYGMKLPVEQALPTLLFMIFLSTLLMAIIWIYIGHKRLTRIIDVLPQPVVSGFLGCIGWKVLKYSWKVSMGSTYKYVLTSGHPWMLYAPAILLGVPLYLLKKKHIGNPMVILPAFLFLPLVFFYIVAAAAGFSMADLRASSWLFDEVEPGNFYDVYVQGYGNMGNVSGPGVVACLGNMAIMIVILVIDSLLKLAATKSNLMIDVDMVHEIRVTGYENVINAFAFGSPGYPQVKFNVLSYGILHNTLDRRIGYVMGVVCGLLWVSNIHLVNVIPRFVMGFLLVYACLPFIVDNLIVSYFHMKKKEFIAVWCIVLTTIIADAIFHSPLAMILAVIVGVLFSLLIFISQYARVSVIRDVFTGETYQSKLIRSYWEEALLVRVGKRVCMVQLEGFIFFASSAEVISRIKLIIDESKQRPLPIRVRYIILDFEHVSNLDYSAIRNFVEIRRMLKAENIDLMMTGLTNSMHENMTTEGIFERQGRYAVKEEDDMDIGTEKVEDMVLKRAAKLRHNWLMFDSFMKIHTEAQLKRKFEVFDMALGGDVGHDLYMYAEPKTMNAGEFICEEGKVNHALYLLQRGRVTSWTSTDDGQLRRVRSMRQGAVINDECMFVDLPVAHSCVADQESVLWAITQSQFRQMELRSPKLFLKIHVYILRYASLVRHRLEREINNIDHSASAAKQKKVKHQRQNHLSLGSKVMEKIREAHMHYKEQDSWAESLGTVRMESLDADTLVKVDSGHHSHHFEHITALDEKSIHIRKGSVVELDDKWKLTKPHLSSVVLKEAIKWFEFHADDVDDSDVDASQKLLDLGNVQKALMDIGLFPTVKNLRQIHNRLMADRGVSGGPHVRIKIDEPEFIELVGMLTLADISNSQFEGLHSLFLNHAISMTDSDTNKDILVLTREELKLLMAEIGHPEDEVELDCIMHEWDLESKGYLVFDSFISVVATFMKIEGQDVQMEEDFLKMCGLTDEEIKAENSEAKKEHSITKESLLIAQKRYGDNYSKFLPEVAEEMVYDADLDRVDGNVSLDEFVNAIEMVGTSELDEVAGGDSMWRLPSGRHLSMKNILVPSEFKKDADILPWMHRSNQGIPS